MKRKQKKATPVKTNVNIKVSAGLRETIDRVLEKKFNKKVTAASKDDCDSCGEQCFD